MTSVAEVWNQIVKKYELSEIALAKSCRMETKEGLVHVTYAGLERLIGGKQEPIVGRGTNESRAFNDFFVRAAKAEIGGKFKYCPAPAHPNAPSNIVISKLES